MLTRMEELEQVKEQFLRLLTAQVEIGLGDDDEKERISSCVICGVELSSGVEELSGKKVSVVLQALLVDSPEKADVEEMNCRLRVCGECLRSLYQLADLFDQLEDLREQFNDLRRRVGRHMIMGSLGRSEESFDRWTEEVNSVDDFYPSRAIRRLRKIRKVGTAEDEMDVEDFEFCVPPVKVKLEENDELIGDMEDPLEVSEFVIDPLEAVEFTRKYSPQEDAKLTKMRSLVVLNRSFQVSGQSRQGPARKRGRPANTVIHNICESLNNEAEVETELAPSAAPAVESSTLSTEKRKRGRPRKIWVETITDKGVKRSKVDDEFSESFEYEARDLSNPNPMSNVVLSDSGNLESEDKSRRFRRQRRFDNSSQYLDESNSQTGEDEEHDDGKSEEHEDEFNPSDNSDRDRSKESEDSSDTEFTPISVKLNRPRIRKPDKRLRKRIRTSGTAKNKQCLLCGKAFDRPWRLRLHIEEFHSGVPKKTTTRKNHMGRTRTAQKVGSNSMIDEEEFPCSHCDLTFGNLTWLSNHQLRTHWLGSEVAGSMQCRYCMKFYLEERTLLAHSERIHKTVEGAPKSEEEKLSTWNLLNENPVNIQCFQCKTTFSTVQELEVHTDTEEHQETLKSKVTVHCNVCRLKLNDPDALQDHLKSEAHLEELKTLGDFNNDTFCVPCRLDLGSHEGLVAHNNLPVHFRKITFRKNYSQDGERLKVPDKCHLCGGTFNFARSLEHHMRVSHKEGGYTCEICGKNFILLRDFKSHRKRHGAPKPFVCEMCGKDFSEERNLRKHVKNLHLGERSICAVCGKEFPSRATLEAHEGAVHFSSSKKCFTHQCTFCPQVFKQLKKLRRHLYQGHREECLKETPYACLVCFHLFPTSEALESHSASHDDFKCPTCGKCFRDKFFLDNHLRVHTGEKPFACTQCDKKFARLCKLKEHMLRHAEKRPFVCSCGAGYVQNHLLQSHREKTGH